MIDWRFAAAIPLAYVLAGSLKFAVNCFRARRLAFDLIGLGGFPSTHSAIASVPAWIMVFSGLVSEPAFTLALALLAVVVIDAVDTRRKIGRVSAVVKAAFPTDPAAQRLRDRTGHSPLEVCAGIGTGGIAGAVLLAPELSAFLR